ncbi:MAG: SDR family NAD(P)-dependent oxidoreductase, partial [Thermoanaerobaculia bacterium]
ADLGIDTVKQAETFAAIREEWAIPREEELQLRDFPTLAHAIQFVYDRRPDLQVAPPAAGAAAVSSAVETGTAPPAEVEAEDPVKRRVLEIVSETTGYPPDMLDLDLDMEADLGIDTVKQAETFAAIREEWGIPRDDDLQLRDFPTLADAIQFVYDRRPDLTPGAASETAVLESVTAGEGPEAVPVEGKDLVGDMEAADSIPRRVPVPVLRPDLEDCRSTNVTLGRGSRVVVMPDGGGIGKALVEQLTKIGVVTLVIDPALDGDSLRQRLAGWRQEGSIKGVYWLPALDEEGHLADLSLEGWRQAVDVRVKRLFTTMRELYEEIGRPGTFLVVGTRLGGQHGYDEAGALAPLGGAVVGFAKTFKRERADALVKAVDFGPSRTTTALAKLLMAETLRDPGVVEVGYKAGRRWTVGLVEEPVPTRVPAMELGKESVFVVTGAAGSIVSAIVADLATASSGTFYLLDLVPEPDPSNPDLELLTRDPESLKRRLFDRLRASGERATPVRVEKELAGLERAAAALAAIRAVEAAGGTARYISVNLLDAGAVEQAIAEVREQHGRIDVLLHAAGLEISHMLPDKEPREFDLVFDVKSNGWFHLMRAIGEMPLGATVAFSSIAGRFGNAGQTDYGAANDLLCKLGSSLRSRRPETRGLVLDWTAWGGIGMATRGSIPKMMDLAGIDMLPPEGGIPIVRRELEAGTRGEVVVAQRLGILLNEWEEDGGVDRQALETRLAGPMVSRVLGMGVYDGLTIETTLDPAEQPFLYDHRIEGIPVLPGVMGIEAFTEAVRVMFPDSRVEAIEDVTFLAPFKFYREEPRAIRVHVLYRDSADGIVAHCRLIGVRQLPNLPEPQVTVHFTARVHLSEAPAEDYDHRRPVEEGEVRLSRDDIYRLFFHGPAYRVIESAWRADGTIVGLMPADLPPHHHPADQPLFAFPRLVELCLQTAGLAEMGATGKMGLPLHIDRLRLVRRPKAGQGRLRAVVEPSSEVGGFDAYVIDEAGEVYVIVHGYRTVELPGAVAEDQLELLRAVMT